MKDALGKLMLIGGLALFGGLGVLAWRIGDTWTEATTQSMVTAAATICAGGAVVFAVLVSLIVGIPMATRYFAESGKAARVWHEMPPPPRMHPATRQLGGYDAPMLTAQKNDQGTWHSGGPGQYDLWENEEPYFEDEPTAAQPGKANRGRFS